MEIEAVTYALVPYIRDVLIGLFPLVCLSEALKASIPFRVRALFWYFGVVAIAFLVVGGDIQLPQSLWTIHTGLTGVGYLVGAYWWVKPRRSPAHYPDLAALREYPSRGKQSQATRRVSRSTLADW